VYGGKVERVLPGFRLEEAHVWFPAFNGLGSFEHKLISHQLSSPTLKGASVFMIQLTWSHNCFSVFSWQFSLADVRNMPFALHEWLRMR